MVSHHYLIYDFPFRCSFPWFLVQEDDDDDGDDDDEPPIPPPTAGAQGVTETGAATKTPPDSRSLLKSGVQDCKWIGGLCFLYQDFWKKHIFRRAAMNLSLDSFLIRWVGSWHVLDFVAHDYQFVLRWLKRQQWLRSSLRACRSAVSHQQTANGPKGESVCFFSLAGHVSQHSLGASSKKW